MATPAGPVQIRGGEALFCEGDEVMSQEPNAKKESPVPPDVYEQLDAAPPEVRREIVMGLIREHPEGRLVLPGHDGVRAMLDGITLSRAGPGPGADRVPEPDPRRDDGRSRLHFRRA